MGAKKKGTEILSALNLCSVDPWPKVTRLYMNLMSQASKLQNNSHSIWAKEAEGGMTTDHVSRDGTTSLFHIPPTTYLIFTVSMVKSSLKTAPWWRKRLLKLTMVSSRVLTASRKLCAGKAAQSKWKQISLFARPSSDSHFVVQQKGANNGLSVCMFSAQKGNKTYYGFKFKYRYHIHDCTTLTFDQMYVKGRIKKTGQVNATAISLSVVEIPKQLKVTPQHGSLHTFQILPWQVYIYEFAKC